MYAVHRPDACGTGHHRDSPHHDGQIADGKVCPLVTVIGAGIAVKIERGVGGIHIDVIGHPAGLTQDTLRWKIQPFPLDQPCLAGEVDRRASPQAHRQWDAQQACSRQIHDDLT